MTTSMLDNYAHDVKRHELFKRIETLALNDPHFAIAFVLWDVVGQLVEINKTLKKLDAIDDCLNDIYAKIPEVEKE